MSDFGPAGCESGGSVVGRGASPSERESGHRQACPSPLRQPFQGLSHPDTPSDILSLSQTVPYAIHFIAV
eukprot:2665191-Rhodomonas_salina.3